MPLRSLQRIRRPAVNGFVLPLTISTSIVLFIGSASLHTMALQARSRGLLELEQRQRSDQLRSAAMTFVQRAVQPAESCLLAWQSALWEGLEAICPGADPARLTGADAGERGQGWTLISWEPADGGASLRLALRGVPAAALFRLSLHSDQLRLHDGLQRIPSSEVAP